MNRSRVNLGNGAVKKTGVKKMRSGGMVKKRMRAGGMVKKMRGGGMVKKVGVKKRMRAGGMVNKGKSLKKPGKGQVGLKKLPEEVRNNMGYMAAGGAVAAGMKAAKEVGKAGKKLFDKQKRKGRPPKTKTAKVKSRVNLGAADPASAVGYVAAGAAIDDFAEMAAGGAVKSMQDPKKFESRDFAGMTAEQRRQQKEMMDSFDKYFRRDKKKKK